MSDIEFKFIESNGINLRLAMMGEGPLVIFCHGWPESWYSWRHQLPVLADGARRPADGLQRGLAAGGDCQQLLRRVIRQLLTMSEVMESQISLMRLKPIL